MENPATWTPLHWQIHNILVSENPGKAPKLAKLLQAEPEAIVDAVGEWALSGNRYGSLPDALVKRFRKDRPDAANPAVGQVDPAAT